MGEEHNIDLSHVEEFVDDLLITLYTGCDDDGCPEYGLEPSPSSRQTQLEEIYALVKKYFSGV
jgi:hypothetical protein